jgi:hypothetical protein
VYVKIASHKKREFSLAATLHEFNQKGHFKFRLAAA